MSEEELRQYCKDASNEIIKLEEENTQLKSVLKEIKEEIIKDRNKKYGSLEKKSFYCSKTNKLLEIIDKVKID